jgi:hypothetical protein
MLLPAEEQTKNSYTPSDGIPSVYQFTNPAGSLLLNGAFLHLSILQIRMALKWNSFPEAAHNPGNFTWFLKWIKKGIANWIHFNK